MNPVVYVFVNKGLHMSAGKVAAQACHAVSEIPFQAARWWDEPHRTMLIMEARDEQHIRNIREYLKKRKILCFSVVDEGVNETESHVLTALATEVLDKDDAEVQKVMSTFKLYRDPIKVTMEIDR